METRLYAKISKEQSRSLVRRLLTGYPQSKKADYISYRTAFIGFIQHKSTIYFAIHRKMSSKQQEGRQ